MAAIQPVQFKQNALWFYRRHWCGPYREWALPLLQGMLDGGTPAGASILEIGCGAGEISGNLAARGFDVTGMEESNEALAEGRDAFPQVKFVNMGPAGPKLPGRFQTVIALNEELGRILNPRDLYRVFLNVHAALPEGGQFIFDLSSECGYREKWNKPSSVVNEKQACFIKPHYSERQRTASAELALFRKEHGTWMRRDAFVEHRCYRPENVRLMLNEAGFHPVVTRVFDEECDPDTPLAGGRTVFLAAR